MCRNALQHLHQEITISKKSGSFSLEESLVDLVGQGHITREDALLYAIHPAQPALKERAAGSPALFFTSLLVECGSAALDKREQLGINF